MDLIVLIQLGIKQNSIRGNDFFKIETLIKY